MKRPAFRSSIGGGKIDGRGRRNCQSRRHNGSSKKQRTPSQAKTITTTSTTSSSNSGSMRKTSNTGGVKNRDRKISEMLNYLRKRHIICPLSQSQRAFAHLSLGRPEAGTEAFDLSARHHRGSRVTEGLCASILGSRKRSAAVRAAPCVLI